MDSWIAVIERKNLKYYFQVECVIVEYNRQYISFNCYALKNRKRFKKFSHALLSSSGEDYGSLNDVFGLANRYGLIATSAHAPTKKSRIF